MTAEQLWSTQLLFEDVQHDNFRARVADEYTKVCDALLSQRGGKPLNKREKDKCEMQAHATVAEEDEQGRPRRRRQAAAKAKGQGGGFYSADSF